MGNVKNVAEMHTDAPQACRSCGEPLNADQEWCLTCGTAAPGRLSRRAGARTVLATVGITLAITGGAVAASYAALAKDPVRKGDIALPYTQVPVATPTAPPVTTAAKTPTKKVKVKKKAPVRAASVTKTKTVAKAPAAKAAAVVKPELLDIPESSGALYDPLARGQFIDDDPHDPAAVLDDDRETSWAVTAGGTDDLQVGYVIDLKKDTSLKYLELVTDTPGFRAEIFGASADEVPPTITDSRWAQLKFRDNVDGTTKEKGKIGDGKERITLPDDNQKYRYLLIWATTPAEVTLPDPPSRTLRLFDVKVYGTPSK